MRYAVHVVAAGGRASVSLDEILAQVDAYPQARHVVVTGGEPMICPQVVELTERFRGARAAHHHRDGRDRVQAGRLRPDEHQPETREFDAAGRWAATHERLRIQPDVLARLLAAYEYQLKFVVAQPEDLDEIRDLLDQLRADRSKVILMPEGIERKRVARTRRVAGRDL